MLRHRRRRLRDVLTPVRTLAASEKYYKTIPPTDGTRYYGKQHQRIPKCPVSNYSKPSGTLSTSFLAQRNAKMTSSGLDRGSSFSSVIRYQLQNSSLTGKNRAPHLAEDIYLCAESSLKKPISARNTMAESGVALQRQMTARWTKCSPRSVAPRIAASPILLMRPRISSEPESLLLTDKKSGLRLESLTELKYCDSSDAKTLSRFSRSKEEIFEPFKAFSSLLSSQTEIGFNLAESSSAEKFEEWKESLKTINDLWDRFLELSDDKDCSLPHNVLHTLQKLVLSEIAGLGVTPMYLLSDALTGENKKVYDGPLVVKNIGEVRKLAKGLAQISGVLRETDVLLFSQFQKPFSTDKSKPLEVIDRFLRLIPEGPTGGRAVVGDPLCSSENFPTVLYGVSSKYDIKLKENLVKLPTSGPEKWTAVCKSMCPLKVYVIFYGDMGSKEDEKTEYLQQLRTMLSRMSSHWKTHLIRTFTTQSKCYQAFLPIMNDLKPKDLLAGGWKEMVFNGHDIIRWKLIKGSLILSFIGGFAEAGAEEALALVLDGDNHRLWIPFLSQTTREFAASKWSFVFSYGVSLPWPLSKRELHLMCMCTDSLTVQHMHSIQVRN